MQFLRRAAMFVAVLLVISGCKRTKRFEEANGMVWNTTYHIAWQGPEELRDSILPVLEDVGSSLNVFDPSSVLSRFNAGDSVAADGHLAQVFRESMRINKLSEGYFDPGLAPLIRAWGFGPGHKATSDTLRLDSLLHISGIGKTWLEKGCLKKSVAGVELNFSAIAKGYGVDCVAAMLARNGVANYLVEIGGEIYCSGHNPTGGKWRISIDKPLFSDSVVHESQAVVALSDCGVASSGNYRNFQTDASGKRFGHTISPKTGRPVQSEVLASTVIAPTAMEADALATALMAMPAAKAKLLGAKTGYPVLLITESAVWQTPQMKKVLME